ncbi:MAG: nucleoside hydrolase [Anaerolineae bacterium]|nr:nucleoside hydrolase [Anaerolineae bacterium]
MPHKIIFDTDPGVDDAMALLFALKSPEIEVLGLTTVFGNSNVEATTRNALNLLDFAGRPDIPVAKGAGVPLVIPPHPTGEFVHGDDAMGNIGWHAQTNPNMHVVEQHAAQFIVEQVMSNPGQITLVPVGPLTNLALALQLEPRIAKHVKEVVMMGGSVLHAGNVSPLAEANVHNDPHAAALVFRAEWPITMAGLDVTEAVQMNAAYFDELAAGGNRFGGFIRRVVAFYQQFHVDWYGMPDGEVHTHDPSAIAYLIDPSIYVGQQWPVTVPTDGPAIGATIADRRLRFWQSPKVNCLMQVDGDRLRALYKMRIRA